MTRVMLLVLIAAASLWAQATECDAYDHRNTWRVTITLPDSTSLDAVLNTVGESRTVVAGEFMAGMTSREVVASWSYFFGPPPRNAYLCTIALKSYSLLQANGAPFGSRISRYSMTIDPKTANVTGKVQFESRDITGAIVNTTSGTFSGAPVSDELDISKDPFWDDVRSTRAAK